jgi:hypothetical protein
MAIASKPVIITLEDAMRPPLRGVDAAAWPTLIKHLSATSLGMLDRCPEQYRRRYLKGEKSRPAGALVWGAADHKAVGWGLEQKLLNGTLPSSSDTLDFFSDAWTAAIDEHGGSSEVDWDDDKPGDLKTKAAALVKVYHEQVSPSISPVAVEHKFERHVAGVPVPLIGYVDVVTQQKVIERKTSKRRESKPKPDWVVQGRIYSAELCKPLEWHVSAKTQRPAVFTPLTDPDLVLWQSTSRMIDSYVVQLANQLASFYALYGPDDPWPGALAHPWACSYCSYRPSCAWWAE